MQKYHEVLLAVWREACRHIEIRESTATIAKLLASHVPLSQIVLRHVEVEPHAIVTVAAGPGSARPLVDHRRTLSQRDYQVLHRWGLADQATHAHSPITAVLKLVIPPDITGDAIALPLAGSEGFQGAVIFVCEPDKTFTRDDVRLLEALREPFSVALENDLRLHEIARLREAAEAEKGALLRRLGRTDLGETIIGEDSGLKPVMDRVALVTHSDVPVLILGETGTGKELVARALHVRSARHHGPFIRVNCGAIPAELIDSQLFGHEKGSFTGADQSRQGWFERADGGTLFLDEIGELPLDAQVRFLRVLQDGFVERVGSAQPIHVDVRVVAATHRDLATMVRAGKFREDLWYRLAVFPVLLPPLRERKQDIRALAEHFAIRAAARFTLTPCQPTPHDLQLLQRYHWPGNIRELGAVIDRAAILGNGKGLEIATALGSIDHNTPPPKPQLVVSPTPRRTADDHDWSLDQAMRQHIETVLALTAGRVEGRSGAAALLQINPHTLRARMRKLHIDWSKFRDAP
jgi:transcriptional regulator with GAF, ATPase, and Fis domain